MFKKSILFTVILGLMVSVGFFGCAPEEGGSRLDNVPPDTFILDVPPESDPNDPILVPHDAVIYWNGSDPDGIVVGYFWRVIYTNHNGQEVVTTWQFTERPEANINFYAPDMDQVYPTTFEVVAVDQTGNGVYDTDIEFPEGLNTDGDVISEPFDDINGNGVWDSDIPEPWEDSDGNGEPDQGEYVDVNGNNFRDESISENFLDLGAIDPEPAYRIFYTQNHPPDSVTITTQPPDWAMEDTSRDPQFCLPDLTRIWRGLSFAWIGSDPDDDVFPLYFKWELQRRSDDQWVRRSKDWISASLDTPYNGNVVFTIDKTYYQTTASFIEYGDDIVEKNADNGSLKNEDYRLIVWARDASWGQSDPDTTNFTVLIPGWVDGSAKKLLVIDETKHNDNWLGTPVNLFTEEEVDTYYDNLFINNGLAKDTDFDVFEFSTGNEEPPTKQLLAQYEMVFWYNDDSQNKFASGIDYTGDNLPDVGFDEVMADYMSVGGNVILSGWRMLPAFPSCNGCIQSFFAAGDPEFDYFHIVEYQEDDSPAQTGDFIGVRSRPPFDLPDIDVDQTKIEDHILFNFQGDGSRALPAVAVYYPAQIFQDPFEYEVYYRYRSRTGSTFLDNFDAVPAMSFKTDTFNSAMISFPLFWMDNSQDRVTQLIGHILDFFNEPLIEN